MNNLETQILELLPYENERYLESKSVLIFKAGANHSHLNSHIGMLVKRNELVTAKYLVDRTELSHMVITKILTKLHQKNLIGSWTLRDKIFYHRIVNGGC